MNRRRGGRVVSPSRAGLVALADGQSEAAFVGQRILELRDEGSELSELTWACPT